jgi:hypothetical protein
MSMNKKLINSEALRFIVLFHFEIVYNLEIGSVKKLISFKLL